MTDFDVIILGGGLAGLTAALHLSKVQKRVLVIEKNPYPNHKVCGEYVSNEVRPYLESLGVGLDAAGVVPIKRMRLTTVRGNEIVTKLPLGGFGISRYSFDYLLYEHTLAKGTIFQFDTALECTLKNGTFHVKTTSMKSYSSKMVIGAYGKRSNFDKQMQRPFMNQQSPWLGVKEHYEYDEFPDDLVALHAFPGGYGGLSKIENGQINFCYLATYDSFKKHKDVAQYNRENVAKNPFLNEFLNKAKPVFEKPLSIAQISFAPKKPVEEHMIMCGDSAGLIHPLCGNGMAMAIMGARLAALTTLDYLNGKMGQADFETKYQNLWKHEFQERLAMGRRIQSLLMRPWLAELGMNTIAQSETLLQGIIRRTHGKPILV
ncbi:MAG: NAD(P)/FAD-dependent oxidoreductase [Croceitalea sp.]|nr:NAD(P)/FAD-dependent oxidoreductase [Croceitalea sp.]